MLAALRGEDAEARKRALADLEAGAAPVDEETCFALIELLGHPTKEVSRRAAGALSLSPVIAAHRPLLERALRDPEPRRRWGAAFALARGGATSEAVLRAAVEALAMPDGDVRWAAAELICRAAKEGGAVAALLAAATASASPEQRKMALYCLRDCGERDAAAFAAALDDRDRTVRLAALAGLSRCDALDDASARRVIAMLRAEHDAGVLRAAAATLSRFGASRADVAETLARLASAADDGAPAGGRARDGSEP